MQPLKVTFENEAGAKAIINISLDTANEKECVIAISLEFKPAVSKDADDSYIAAAMKYVKQFTSEII
ncbi:MAG: hypothetical protein ACO1OF_16330 [Adhaeribacter sp.]